MCNYFLWGHFKLRVYKHKPLCVYKHNGLCLYTRQVCVYKHTLEELKEAIHKEVTRIDRAMIEKVYANFKEHLQKCFTDNRHHMTDVVFHT